MDTKITKTTKTTKNPLGLDLSGLRNFVLFVLAVGAVPLLTACASASAKAPAERPALDVPAPPPHVIEPAQEPTDPVGELPPAPAPSPGASRSTHPVSPKADATPPPETATPVAPSAPNPQLRTPQTADTSGAAKSVRTVLDRAKNTLATVNYGPLNNERKKAYNDAKQFIQQAEDALKEGNFVFAQGVASKAETLARELAGR